MLTRKQILDELDHAKMLLTTNDFKGTRVRNPKLAVVAMLQNIVSCLEKMDNDGTKFKD